MNRAQEEDPVCAKVGNSDSNFILAKAKLSSQHRSLLRKPIFLSRPSATAGCLRITVLSLLNTTPLDISRHRHLFLPTLTRLIYTHAHRVSVGLVLVFRAQPLHSTRKQPVLPIRFYNLTPMPRSIRLEVVHRRLVLWACVPVRTFTPVIWHSKESHLGGMSIHRPRTRIYLIRTLKHRMSSLVTSSFAAQTVSQNIVLVILEIFIVTWSLAIQTATQAESYLNEPTTCVNS